MEIDGAASGWHPQQTGLRKGCLALPFLLVALVQVFIEDVHRLHGRRAKQFRVMGADFDEVIYADDTTLACNSYEDLQQVIPIFLKYCENFDILVNAKKTLWMRMGDEIRYDENNKRIIIPPTEREKFIINNISLAKTDRFKFLGFWMLANGGNREHIKKRTAMYV